MNDQTRIFVGVAIGALAGAVVTAVCLTDRGRGNMARLDGALDELTEALARFRGTIRRASAAADEGRALVDDVKTTVLEHRSAAPPQVAS